MAGQHCVVHTMTSTAQGLVCNPLLSRHPDSGLRMHLVVSPATSKTLAAANHAHKACWADVQRVVWAQRLQMGNSLSEPGSNSRGSSRMLTAFAAVTQQQSRKFPYVDRIRSYGLATAPESCMQLRSHSDLAITESCRLQRMD